MYESHDSSEQRHDDAGEKTLQRAPSLWCCRYLLGELDEQQTQRFEAELAHSETLAEQLLRHAETLCELSESSTYASSVAAGAASPLDAGAASPLAATARRATEKKSPWALALCAIAATLLMTFGLWQWNHSRRSIDDRAQSIASKPQTFEQEQLLIAKAWVSTPLHWSEAAFDEETSLTATSPADIASAVSDSWDTTAAIDDGLREPDFDSQLSWMTVALADETSSEDDVSLDGEIDGFDQVETNGI